MINNLFFNILGNINNNSIKIINNNILLLTFIFIFILFIIILLLIIYYKLYKNIWNKWIKSLDHKKIGIMYIILAIIMLFRGFIDAIMMRIQQSISFGNYYGFLSSEHYNEIFTAHGVIMIFFVAMPLIIGIMNYIIPLQIGARDIAFPFLNNLSFWLTFSGAILIMLSLFIGEFANTGWLAYPPLSNILNNPGAGVDYYIWSLQISSIGTILSSINFITTIIKMRAPGMNLMKMPIFIWTSLCSNILILISFPILTSVLLMLSVDRLINGHFFTNNLGGNIMMYTNLIWMWGHPEVYILILPAFGIFSEITSTFCNKSLFGYNSMVYATITITFFSYIVWLHHFFTMGAGANVNAFFGITTMIISIPTGVKIFNWIFTMYKGKIRFEIPILWTIAFIITFTIGGMAGVLLAIPPIDYLLHNSLFLVAHFHTVIIGGVVFSIFAGINYWFPKVFGYKLNNFLGICSFLFWIIGFYIAFIPLYILGFMGVTRRLNHFKNYSFKIWFNIALLGTILIFIGIIFFIIQLIVSYFQKKILIDKTGDPWNARTLEWSIKSPPKKYNFAFIPKIHKKDEWIYIKNIKYKLPKIKNINNINLPKNTKSGFIISILCLLIGFNIIWHMWLLFIINFIFIIIYIIKYFLKKKKKKKILNIKIYKEEKNNLSKKKNFIFYKNIKYFFNIKKKKKKNTILLGFWIYLMSDCLIFSCFFIAYAILKNNNYYFIKNKIFNLKIIIINTIILLLSSLIINFINYYIKNKNIFYIKLILKIIFLLGLIFILLEYYEFKNLIKNNYTIKKNGFLTSFFILISIHGIHVIVGILWIIILLLKIKKFNIKYNIISIKCLSMFWHFLDIIWISIFTFVYLIGLC